jgi:hypothetical protein
MRTRPCGRQPPNENALVDENLGSFQVEEADEDLELPRLVAYGRLGVMRDERRKSMVETKQPRQTTPDRQRDSSKCSGVSSERARTDIVNWIEGFHNHRRLHTAIG